MPKPRAAAVKVKCANTLVLAADLRVAQVNELKLTVTRALARMGPVELDASAVKQIDAASLQLLAAFVAERRLKNRTVRWRAVAPVFAHAAQRLDLKAALAMEPT